MGGEIMKIYLGKWSSDPREKLKIVKKSVEDMIAYLETENKEAFEIILEDLRKTLIDIEFFLRLWKNAVYEVKVD